MDILEEYNFKTIKKEIEISFTNEIEKKLFDILKYNTSLNIDDILDKTNLNYFEIS
jgi:hypothetical protein